MSNWRDIEARALAGGPISRDELREVIAKGKSRTADVSERIFLACPEWVAEHEARAAARRAKHERYLLEELPLREDLHRLGHPVKTVWDFVNTNDSYTDAIPTLISHLARPYPRRRVSWSRGAAPV